MVDDLVETALDFDQQSNMESALHRRLDSLVRHLVPPQSASQDLTKNPLNITASGSDSVSASPVLIGGMVLDIHAKPYNDLAPRTTNPGEVQYASGGVARNIAECMCKLGARPFMISVVGLDMAGEMLLRYWKSAGLSTEGILQEKSIATPVVTNIFDSYGELAAGVASVDAVEKFLTPYFVQQFQSYICSAPVLLLDANLHPQSLEFACRTAGSGIPVWFEPVSVKKSTRISSIVNYITYASPNEIELIAMANSLLPEKEFKFQLDPNGSKMHSVESLFQMLKPAISFVLCKGIKCLVVTLGQAGVFLCFRDWPQCKIQDLKSSKLASFSSMPHAIVDEGQLGVEFQAYHFPALNSSVVNPTGAGDCLVAGVIASICSGLDLMRSVAIGIAVAKAAVESKTNVPAEFNMKDLAGEAESILSGVKHLLV
ncbi:pseudouridine kinase-like isoform X2 [Zingiber officinale]|uniref:pseudouridine kinase-like isoform X2 n=1 Tax=Zingiber officinale TaxID=94328 RepID=UPI001C4C0320|nr:pseudouridine kinase-like isoform X2 [Zingiber officinale]